MMRYRDISNQVSALLVTHFEGSHLSVARFEGSHLFSKVPAFPVAHFEGSRLSGHPFRRFPPFRSPVSKVPAFPVAYFKGSHLIGRPFRKFPPFRSPVSKVPAFPVTHFEGSGFRSTGRIALGFRSTRRTNWFWDFEVLDERNWVASPSTDGIGSSAWWILNRISRSQTSFRRFQNFEGARLERSRTLGSFRISIWDWDTGS
ncbi:unnamed protein product [Rhizophagus irregularis]|nr:unnamed protein product [Rhizophagus irregularis]